MVPWDRVSQCGGKRSRTAPPKGFLDQRGGVVAFGEKSAASISEGIAHTDAADSDPAATRRSSIGAPIVEGVPPYHTPRDSLSYVGLTFSDPHRCIVPGQHFFRCGGVDESRQRWCNTLLASGTTRCHVCGITMLYHLAEATEHSANRIVTAVRTLPNVDVSQCRELAYRAPEGHAYHARHSDMSNLMRNIRKWAKEERCWAEGSFGDKQTRRTAVEYCRFRSLSGAIPGVRGNGRTAPWSCTHVSQLPNSNDVVLRENDVVFWVASDIGGKYNSIREAPEFERATAHVVATFNSGWVPLLLQCVSIDSPTPLLSELLQCWDDLRKRDAMGQHCANVAHSDESRNLLETGVRRAMSEYRRLGAIWKAC